MLQYKGEMLKGTYIWAITESNTAHIPIARWPPLHIVRIQSIVQVINTGASW